MPVTPPPGSGGEKPITPAMADLSQKDAKIGPQWHLTPQEAAKVFEKVLVKELLLQTMREMKKDQAKFKQAEQEDVYGA